MMTETAERIKHFGIDSQRIHFESFGPAKAPGSAASKSKRASKTRDVSFQLSGKSVSWNAKDGTLLDLAESQGAVIDTGCRAGSCGSCLTAILKGKVDYIDEPGCEVEAGSCLPCIAVPKTDLTLNA